MDTGERLSAYLAGELDADERTALQAELAGDPALRARLERLGRTNEALASLPDVEVPAAFSTRLRQAVRDELVGLAADAPAGVELATRRLQRDRRSRWRRSGGLAAAAAAVAAVVAVGVLDGDGGDDAGDVAMDAMEAAPEAGAPFVRVTDTDYDEDAVQALAEDPGVTGLPDRVDDQAAAELARERLPAFGIEPLDDTAAALSAGTEGDSTGGAAPETADEPVPAAEDPAGDPDTAPGEDEEQLTPSSGTARTSLDDADPFVDARRCLPQIHESANEPVIPLYAEVARYEGEPAILYLLLTREPDARFYNRIEVWVVARSDCQPLLFTQADH